MSKEAMKLALEALQNELSIDWTNNEEFNSSAEQMCDAIKALKEALAKQEQCKYPNCDYPCMNLPDCQQQGEPVVGTKTWFEDGKVVTQNLYYSDVYTTPQPKQEQGEPVAWADHGVVNWIADKQFKHAALLYEHPQQRTWVGLTDEEMYLNCPNWLSQEHCKTWVQQIEAKLKQNNGYAEEKNT